MDFRETKQFMYHLKSIDKSSPKMHFLLNLSHCVKIYGHFCSILAPFTMPAHQVWSCHVTQDPNFEHFFYFCPNSTFNIRKSHKISGGKALYFRSYPPKTPIGGGGDTPPSAFRIKRSRNDLPMRLKSQSVLFIMILTL